MLLIVSIIFLLCYCSESGEEPTICEECGNHIEEGVKDADIRYGKVCAECALRYEYIQCKYCGLYFDRDWSWGYHLEDSNADLLYCEKCAKEKLRDCYFCKYSYLEEELAEFTYNNETYYMCIRHCEGYLDRQPFKICSDGDGICATCIE